MNDYCIRYGPVTTNLVVPDAHINPLREQIEPFFDVDEGFEQKQVTLAVEQTDYPAPLREVMAGEHSVIDVDTSLYAHLSSSGKRWDMEGGHLVQIDKTGSLFHLDRAANRIAMYQPDDAYLRVDLIRTIKLLTTVMLESQGAIQLHSSAVVVDGADGPTAVMLVGDMWQGKTTVLLELLAGFRVRQLSCDTTCVFLEGEQLHIRGWPSPFSVSEGTMSDHAELASKIPPDRRQQTYAGLWKDAKKAVFESKDVTAWFSTSIAPACNDLSSVLHLRFAPDEPTGLAPLEESQLIAALEQMYLGSRDPIYHNWLQYLVIDEATLSANIENVSKRIFARASTHRVTWAPSVVSLLKQVSPLGNTHKVVGEVLSNPCSS